MEFTGKNKVGTALHGVNPNLKKKNHVSKISLLDWTKTAKQFSVNSHGKYLCQHQASSRAGKPALGLGSFFLRILDTFLPFKLVF